MFFMKPNGRFAVVLAGVDDERRLDAEGVEELARKANSGDKYATACLQRLVNSNFIPEGYY